MTRGSARSAFVAVAACVVATSGGACGVDAGGDAPLEDAGDPDGGTASADAALDAPVSDDADAARDPNDEDARPPGPLTPSFVDFAINHVLWTGQSNAVANGGDPPLTSAQPFTNIMFDTGVMPMSACDGDGCTSYQIPSHLVPLVEGDRFFGYPVETVSAGLANEISHSAAQRYGFGTRAGYPAKHDVLVSGHGRSGNTYWCLRKGGCAYDAAPPPAGRGKTIPFAQGTAFGAGPLFGHGEVADAKALAAAAGRSYVVRAVVAIHGESDHYADVNGTPELPLDGTDGTPGAIKSYADALVEWQRDYDAAIKAITGQAIDVPLLVSQLSGWTTTRESRIANDQLAAHVRAPGKVLLVTPGYVFPGRGDCLHYSNHGYRRLGEYFAKVYARVVFGGETWEPVRPKSIARAGAVITVKYFVPNPPLVLDTVQIAPIDPAKDPLGKMGFDVWDDGARVAIASVAVTAPDTVTITLAAAPKGVGMRLTYAQNQDTNPATRCIGSPNGARGNLRDSDTWPSYYAGPDGQPYTLQNWGVMFDAPIP